MEVRFCVACFRKFFTFLCGVKNRPSASPPHAWAISQVDIPDGQQAEEMPKASLFPWHRRLMRPTGLGHPEASLLPAR